MIKFFKHLHMVNKHRWIVFKLCIRCGIFWRGLLHDLSKYSFAEFWEGVKYYDGTKSPITVCKKTNGYSKAWLHHKGRNKHHFEYWFDKGLKEQINMPYTYAVEGVCDKIAASMCYNGKNYNDSKVIEYWNTHNYEATNEPMKNFYTQVYTDLSKFGKKYILNKKYLKKTYEDLVINSNEN